ncbi:MAG TPA: [FeFe] hydrogenase H-cluster radical SAM maturase HydE [Atribacteraceae bacterium]|nr:[FeFe] hydrogenase H-cluster radical SAM maturase HydE [Atribacteraceae bacterium]
MSISLKKMVLRLRIGKSLSREDLAALLESGGENADFLRCQADALRQEVMGNRVHLRGLIEFSNHCERNCLYCGLRRGNTSLERYRLSGEEVFQVARTAVTLGYQTVVLQSGEDSQVSADDLARIVRRLKRELDLAVTLCVGERDYEEYALWRREGADRYLLKHETADPAIYRRLHPDMIWNRRTQRLAWLRKLGYQVGSGCMVGLPGQDAWSLAGDLIFLRTLDVEMAGIGPFVPHPATPLGNTPGGDVEMTLNAVALSRLLLPQVHLPATTALGSIHPRGRQMALQAGANVVMPNLTPKPYRRLYEIYPDKICLDDDPSHCRQCIQGIITSLGRRVADDPGHSPKLVFHKAMP